MAHHGVLRISREMTDIQKGGDLSIVVACQDHDVRTVQALVLGPSETPYQYGFFEFEVKFGPNYPLEAPKVTAKTTNAGRCRFNPNIYADGKVCLSILGTWQGNSGEQWSSAQGLESVLLSIQSLMSNNPYENEPGFEDSKNDVDKEIREEYCDKIQHETLRIAVIQKLERILGVQADGAAVETPPPTDDWVSDNDEDVGSKGKKYAKVSKGGKESLFEPFNDLLKRRFLWYFENYMIAIDMSTQKHRDGQTFTTMPFEASGNEMSGTFQYGMLQQRLIRIKDLLVNESQKWAIDGLRAMNAEASVAHTLRTQFDQFSDYQRTNNINNIDVNLVDNNSFVWLITYFGKSGTQFDGGIFQIRLSISPNFPDEQPRATVETKMYHHRVSKDGVLCYFPTKTDSIKHHVQSILDAIEDDSPGYDPRAVVHPDATKLFWGNEEDRKKYNRAQRRSAQSSTDDGGA